MWIRSQDKETLINCNVIEYNDFYVKNAIVATSETISRTIVGKYSTKEKALKVLDVIQHKIIELDKNKFLGMTEEIYRMCVFQMTQDDEVTLWQKTWNNY